MDKVTSWSVRTETNGVEGAAQLRFVLGMSGEVPELVDTVSELALFPILAATTLLVGPTQLRLVSASVVLAILLLLLLLVAILGLLLRLVTHVGHVTATSAAGGV